MCIERTQDFLSLAGGASAEVRAEEDNATLQRANNDVKAFSSAAAPIMREIIQVLAMVKAQRGDYIDVHRHTVSKASLMTDSERDHLETEVSKFVQQESARIDQLKGELVTLAINPQTMCHCNIVVESLLLALQGINESMKAMREERLAQLKRDQQSLYSATFDAHAAMPDDALVSEYQHDDDGHDGDDQAALSELEQTQLQLENEEFYKQMNDTLDQVRQAERTLYQLSKMIGVMSSKITEQETQVEELYSMAFDSTANIQQGNQHLRKAIERGEGSRFMSLFIIALASFALLFLDWYM